MGADHVKRITKLQDYLAAVNPEDTMAEAGRKVLLVEFIRMLQHEAGSRVGEDSEDVHQMRVAIRRMRSAFRLLREEYKPKSVYGFRRRLSKITETLAIIRDLDVLIEDLQRFSRDLDAAGQDALAALISKVDAQRAAGREAFIALLNSKAQKIFVKEFSTFLTTAGAGVRIQKQEQVVPQQVRHLLPIIIHSHLAAVRAYDPLLEYADGIMLHDLRIQFKRLRYAVAFFADILGSTIENFIKELKLIQDHLGRINDIATAYDYLDPDLYDDMGELEAAAARAYLDSLAGEHARLVQKFPTLWARFNSRSVQRKVSDALLVLR